jgi:hypothetical protein
MEKRSYSLVASPHKSLPTDNRKKIKVSTSPKKPKVNENNANVLNFNSQEELNNELDGLCFDEDDDDEEFRASVS